ncbi:alpha-D-ribose 1-methylphosphonate 5-triphosphate diphosphatase [Cognatishimia sp.]|uniref:alpha-D-ribose 1-methylphosphonate 5-triphosphate diphosphatase n=1 Tax=Cognatishimia sp. TaxID=2211648 RepID=UPI003514FF38|nr:alpha-D-ribose 1-methylphosphonate 5-triphosphate diphosphatase [Cognatishimia sp.]
MSVNLRLTGAEVLGPDGLEARDLGVSEGRLSADTDGRCVDLSGYMICPAFVDIHGDGFERHLAPRRGVLKDLGQGLASTDAELASNGIGTAVLAQFFSWEGGMRGTEFAARFLAAHRAAQMLTDTRVQLRFETHLLAQYAEFEALVADYVVPYVVFNDHLPHAALAKGKKPPRLTGQALKSGRSPGAHLALLKELHAQSDAVSAVLPKLAARLSELGARLGAHDNETAEQVQGFHEMGASIGEFPVTRDAAEAHRDVGAPVILGSPNVVRGGSHSGRLSAADLIADGLCDALASDYHYPAMKQAVFRLVDEGVVSLAQAWALVSSGPAGILGLTDRGEIAEGLRADMVILNKDTRQIEATLVGGNITYMAGVAAQRFLA